MIKKITLLLIVVFLYLPISQAAAKDELSVTYIANEGFLIESEGKKVLIDALFGNRELGFCDVPPPATLQKMAAAQPPYDHVDLILVTHNHVDHFDAGLVAKHLENNPHCKMVGTDQTVDRLRRLKNFEKLKSRIRAVTPAFGSSEKLTINGIEVSVLRLKHGTYLETDRKTGKKVDRHRNMQNLGFLITLGKHRIFHNGDSGMENAKEYAKFHLNREKIDVAFLGSLFWRPFEPKIKIVNTAIQPRHIVLMHLDKGNKERYFVLRESHQKKLAPIVIFRTPLENKVFEK